MVSDEKTMSFHIVSEDWSDPASIKLRCDCEHGPTQCIHVQIIKKNDHREFVSSKSYTVIEILNLPPPLTAALLSALKESEGTGKIIAADRESLYIFLANAIRLLRIQAEVTNEAKNLFEEDIKGFKIDLGAAIKQQVSAFIAERRSQGKTARASKW